MVTRQDPADIVAALMTGLDGVVITTTSINGYTIETTLKPSEDDDDPTVGTETNCDGGYTVICRRSPMSLRYPADGTGFHSLNKWRVSITVRMAYAIDGTVPGILVYAKPQIESQFVDAIRAILEPSSGPNWAMDWTAIDTRRSTARPRYHEVMATLLCEVVN